MRAKDSPILKDRKRVTEQPAQERKNGGLVWLRAPPQKVDHSFISKRVPCMEPEKLGISCGWVRAEGGGRRKWCEPFPSAERKHMGRANTDLATSSSMRDLPTPELWMMGMIRAYELSAAAFAHVLTVSLNASKTSGFT